MTIERIRELLDLQPFRPFVMHLADGREIPVHHRELIIAAPSGRTLIVVHPDGKGNVNHLAGRIGTIAAAAIEKE